MPINPINAPQKAGKKDLADKILQGLQITEAAFKIPVAYEQIRAYKADADTKSAEARGATTRAKLGQGGVVLIPKAEVPALTPPGAAAGGAAPLMPKVPDYYGPKLSTFKVTGENGDEEVQGYRAEDKSKFFDDEKGLRAQYEGHALTKDTTLAMLNARKAMSALNKKEALGTDDIAAVYGFFHTMESQSAVKEGEFKAAADAAGLFSKLGNMDEQLKKGTFLGPKGRDAMKKTIAGLVKAQLDTQKVIDDRYGQLAKDQTFKPENVVTGFWSKKEESKPVLPPEQHSRLEELRKKRSEGTLGK
jgi:hypothetical protein